MAKFELLNKMPTEISEGTLKALEELEDSFIGGWEAAIDLLKQGTLDNFIIPHLNGG